MSFVNTKAIVVRAWDTGEGDRVITLIAMGIGKINVYAGGVRKTKNKNSAATDIFAYSDFNLYVQSGKYRLNSAELIESFYNLRNDIFAITYASHCAEIMMDTVQEEQPADDMLLLYLCTMYMLSGGADPELITACFELKTVCLSGFTPRLKSCVRCGAIPEGSHYYYSVEDFGLVCRECGGGEGNTISIGEGCLRGMQYVAGAEIRRIFKFSLNDVSKLQFVNICRRIIEKVNEKQYQKLDYLKKLKE